MTEHLLAAFPGLRTTTFRVTSSADAVYNCIAWAAAVSTEWCWPLPDPAESYWPPSVPRVVTLENFRNTFLTIGYSIATDDTLETGFEKVAIFANSQDRPMHAARQLPTGMWTSKLGQGVDIEHELHALSGEIYGTVVLMMKRQKGTTA